jgi:hypothetical protein
MKSITDIIQRGRREGNCMSTTVDTAMENGQKTKQT